jgi:hypothetical protein
MTEMPARKLSFRRDAAPQWSSALSSATIRGAYGVLNMVDDA